MPYPIQPAQCRQPRPEQPSPLSCAVILGECIREERGKQGLCCFINTLSELLPFSMVEQIACRLNVPMPPQKPQLPSPPPKPKQGEGIGMNQLMQLMRMMEQFKK